MASSAVRAFRAPGRVNLIGEHTDYNEGFVFPQAIDRYITIEAIARDDATIKANSEEMQACVEFPLESERAGDWSDYVRGVAAMLAERGLIRRGAELRIRSTLPLGGGLSSSAALEVAAALALLALNDATLPPGELALLCQRAEHEYPKTRCGIMDQFIVTHAKEGTALQLDCRSLDYRHVRLPAPGDAGGVRLVVANTMVKHELAGSAYNERRRQCEEAARRLGRKSLREVSAWELQHRGNDLPGPVLARARHVVEENDRVLKFAEALEAGDWKQAGELMFQSHASLRDLYEVSCAELDFMVETGRELGSVGSRMTGGGFGGCTIHFVTAARAEAFSSELTARYEARFGIRPQVFDCTAAGAATELT